MRSAIAKAAFALAAAALIAGGVGAAGAAGTAELSTRNVAAFDTVDIALVTDGDDGPTLIYDNATAESGATVVNRGAECWVRVRATLSVDGAELSLPSADEPNEAEDSSSDGATEDAAGADGAESTDGTWIQGADGYFYLSIPLAEGASVPFSVEAANPFGDAWDGSAFEIASTITAEAVQATVFEPDFSAADPWKGVKPETCVYARGEGGSDAPNETA